MCCRIRSATNALILEKLLKVSVINANEHSEGAIINYLQSDVQKFDVTMWAVNTMIMGTLNIVLVLVLGVYIFKYTFLLLVIFLILLGYINGVLYKFRIKYGEMWSK